MKEKKIKPDISKEAENFLKFLIEISIDYAEQELMEKREKIDKSIQRNKRKKGKKLVKRIPYNPKSNSK